MTTYPHLPVTSTSTRPRSGTAALLRAASRSLVRVARRLEAHAWSHHRAAETERRVPMLEFHAEAGALEGALFVDGRFVGHLPTSRL